METEDIVLICSQITLALSVAALVLTLFASFINLRCNHGVCRKCGHTYHEHNRWMSSGCRYKKKTVVKSVGMRDVIKHKYEAVYDTRMVRRSFNIYPVVGEKVITGTTKLTKPRIPRERSDSYEGPISINETRLLLEKTSDEVSEDTFILYESTKEGMYEEHYVVSYKLVDIREKEEYNIRPPREEEHICECKRYEGCQFGRVESTVGFSISVFLLYVFLSLILYIITYGQKYMTIIVIEVSSVIIAYFLGLIAFLVMC